MLYGIPNPDYMLMFPGGSPSFHWCDQYHRYFPVQEVVPPGVAVAGLAENPDFTTVGGIGDLAMKKDKDVANLHTSVETASWTSAPAPFQKMVCDSTDTQYPYVEPQLTTPKGDYPFLKAPFVPGIDKDNAWRITRAGRKYQEIIADEIMDYQVNPWWPNPVAQFSEMAVPLELQNYPTDTRVPPFVEPAGGAELGGTPPIMGLNYTNDSRPGKTMQSVYWASYRMFMNQANIWDQVPDYYSYFNRYWVRVNHLYTRGLTNNYPARIPEKRVGAPYDTGLNATESRGKYPSTSSILGSLVQRRIRDKERPSDRVESRLWQDNIRDYLENTVEDQLGAEFRYLDGRRASHVRNPFGAIGTATLPAAQLTAAPGRNHPFKNWADFVAMLGHLVYRSPITVVDTARGITLTSNRSARVISRRIRDRILGVNAWAVCHGPFADPRNQNQFFDGSMIAAKSHRGCISGCAPGLLYVQSGRRYFGNVEKLAASAVQAIVAVDGFWPVSGNLGVFNDPTGSVGAGQPPEALLYPKRPAGMFADTGNFSKGADPDWEWKRRVDEIGAAATRAACASEQQYTQRTRGKRYFGQFEQRADRPH